MLSNEQWAELNGIIVELHNLETEATFREFLLERLCQYLGATFASWNIHDENLRMVRVVNSPAFDQVINEMLPILNETLPGHPLFDQFIDFNSGKLRCVETVERTRDHISLADYQKLPFYTKVARQVSVEDQLAIHVRVQSGKGILLMYHSNREFTQEEHLKASILRGHILARLHTLERQTGQFRDAVVAQCEILQTRLTPREFETLRHLCQGMSNSEISSKLYISSRTVEKHVEKILSKLGIDCRTRVIARYAPYLEDRHNIRSPTHRQPPLKRLS
ncbi:helix-turn-helix transcriptional regulator [Puniceicoccus vermicola]|uniref:Response regulator transcription factor n=1 Tax=Puniceicoccus vermicola TaxID=388746 RepID=A0A7X1B4A3_9BACT|nr:LuxR C-terminal-related transcriptional regulator [Puniceicoccus vermicola]MBC2604125.1 response regulator transcription factor [Puniceicoccus vermicola]